MATLSITIPDELLTSARRIADEQRKPIDAVVVEALRQHVHSSAGDALRALWELADREGWRSDGSGYLTDAEMYDR